jgi:hypothetical protein
VSPFVFAYVLDFTPRGQAAAAAAMPPSLDATTMTSFAFSYCLGRTRFNRTSNNTTNDEKIDIVVQTLSPGSSKTVLPACVRNE